MSDDNVMILFGFGVAVIACAMISAVLSKIVALNSSPDVRATWTAVPAAIIAAALAFAAPDAQTGIGYALFVIPAALLTYWFWRREFRAAWLDNDAPIPEGLTLANTDWRIGLAALLSLLVVAAIRAVFIGQIRL